MAIVDITFTEGEKQLFTLELPVGARNAAADILAEPSSARYPVAEVASASGDSNVFIITE